MSIRPIRLGSLYPLPNQATPLEAGQ
jgi:hypothetical protein